MEAGKIRPSRWWYGLSPIILATGFACCIVLFVNLFVDAFGGIERIIVPGTAQVNFVSAGDYLIWHEHKSQLKGREFSTRNAPVDELKYSVRAVDGQAEAIVFAAPLRMTYELYSQRTGRRKGELLRKMNVAESGVYDFTAEYVDGRTTPEVVLAIKPDTFWTPLKGVIFGGLLSIITMLASGGIFWTTFYKRWKAKKQLAQQHG